MRKPARSVVARDGVPVQGSLIRLDTLLVGSHQAWDVVFLADNPVSGCSTVTCCSRPGWA
jgi:hypothetical protein